ncbi:MAG: cellulase family glycosylhydrolase [Trueperaceae bacterium]|nr:MAG: cellulase family glycosylhydrolase [Trueperaceae bacterium]
MDGPHLRGANIWQRLVVFEINGVEIDGDEFLGSSRVGPPYTQEDFNRLADLGANYVNISTAGLYTEKPPYQLDEAVQDHLDKLLAMIAQADMFAVIAFRTGPGRSDFTFYSEDVEDPDLLNDRVWLEQEAQDAWVAMWRYTAQRYRKNDIVVGYDLMVEPNAEEVFFGTYDPDEFFPEQAGTLYDWNQLHPRISTSIREVDPDTPILIGSSGYSGVEWLPYLQPTGDSRTVYTIHQYEPFDYTHQFLPLEISYPGELDLDYDGIPDPFDREALEDILANVDAFQEEYGVPLTANEFGPMRWQPGAAEFMHDQMDVLEIRGMNHAFWVFNPSWPMFNEEVDDFDFLHGPDPDNHSNVDTSELIEVIKSYWARNTLRPSTVSED